MINNFTRENEKSPARGSPFALGKIARATSMRSYCTRTRERERERERENVDWEKEEEGWRTQRYEPHAFIAVHLA